MSYYCNPLNVEYKFQHLKTIKEGNPDKNYVYREAADPSMILFKGLYYIFPSMTAGFLTSRDMVKWKFQPFLSDMPIYDYAPDVRVVGDYLYFSASKRGMPCSFYRTKDPLTEPFEEIEGTFEFWDPNLFLDDDGRLYFYWGCSNMEPIYGVELDPETMRQKTEPKVMLDSHIGRIGFERKGNDHTFRKSPEQIEAEAENFVQTMLGMPEEMRIQQGITDRAALKQAALSLMSDRPFIEGAWMTKYNGKYYLQYAFPGTEFNIYGDGVYVGDAPLGPFELAKNNPYSYKPGGFMPGAGHGSTMEDKNGKFWHTATMRISYNQNFERRIGIWKAGFDDDGEMFCDQRYGDWPVNVEIPAFSNPDWMLLSYKKSVSASSGVNPEAAADEDCTTWWRAGSAQPGEWLIMDLEDVYHVHAVQINFMEDRIKTEFAPGEIPNVSTIETRAIDRSPKKTCWLLEGSLNGTEYFVIEDKMNAETDFSHDCVIRENGVKVRYLRLTTGELPYGETPCISGLRVFGKAKGAPPKQTEEVQVTFDGELDMTVSWKEDYTAGHNILWGHSPEKLYHSYMVFGKNSQHIGALVEGEEVYVRVDAFNESGIAEGNVMRYR